MFRNQVSSNMTRKCKTCSACLAHRGPQAQYCEACVRQRNHESDCRTHAKRRSDSVIGEKIKAAKRAAYHKDAQDPAWIEAERTRKRDSMRRMRADPQWKAKDLIKCREREKTKYWSDPEFRAKKQDRARARGRTLRRQLPFMIERQANLCSICNTLLPKDISGIDIDHVIPRSMGGTDKLRNLSATHAKCNAQKRDNILPSQLLIHHSQR